MGKGRWTDIPTLEDQLGFEGYSRSLVKVVWESDTPITVGIFGTWGSGKTSLMRMVQKDLEEGKGGKTQAKTIWFDAWKYDKEDVLWRALLLSVLEALRPSPSKGSKKLSEKDEKLVKELDDLQDSLYRDVDREEAGSIEIDWKEGAKGTLKLGFSFLPLLLGPAGGFISALGGNEKTGIVGAPKDAIDHLVSMFKRERIKIHQDHVQFLDQFQKKFSGLVKSCIPEGGRLVVFIDDLDRCLPEKAIEILEAIKLFLEVERCVFVVGVDQRIIEQGIKVKYQSLGFESRKKDIPIKGDEYLEKIVQIPFYLPPLDPDNITDFTNKRLEGEFEEPVADVLSRGMEANPRKIKRVLNIFRLLWTLAGERGMVGKDDEKGEIEADLLAKMVVIQSRWRDTLYADVVEYHNLLGDLEDHFERKQQEAKFPPQHPPERQSRVPDETPSSPVEGISPDRPAKPQETLVDRYARLKPLEKMLLTPNAARFKGKDLDPYIYLTATVVEKRGREGDEISVDERIWEDLMSNDPTKIQAAVNRIEDRQRRGYINRLLNIISNQETNDLNTRIAAGNALGMLGDPRFVDLESGNVKLEMEMVPIPEGPFKMGSEEGRDDEKPQHEVHLDTFEIAKYPLTNIQYKAFLDANPGHPEPQGWNNRTFPAGKANHPVVNISWNDAQAYAKWLSEKTGKDYRLPTEAEWEKAARGTDGRTYPWGNKFDPSKCNTSEGGPGGTTPVGIYPEGASPYGVMDMAGNVWEWCEDWYGEDYYKQGENRNPKGPKSGKGGVVRGGSWISGQDIARCSGRFRLFPGLRLDGVGVRFSRTPLTP
jgi:formylglycine-generating enzyme required for sulfatase activity